MKSCNIIIGEKGEGKTTKILSIASKDSHAAGFASIHRGDEYYLRNIENGEETLFFSHSYPFEERWRGWYINSALFDSVYRRMMTLESGAVFLDECGRLEIEGYGFSRTISLLMGKDVDLYITLRRPFLEEFLSSFSIVDYTLIPVDRRTDCG